jgi:hypothetical protein
LLSPSTDSTDNHSQRAQQKAVLVIRIRQTRNCELFNLGSVCSFAIPHSSACSTVVRPSHRLAVVSLSYHFTAIGLSIHSTVCTNLVRPGQTAISHTFGGRTDNLFDNDFRTLWADGPLDGSIIDCLVATHIANFYQDLAAGHSQYCSDLSSAVCMPAERRRYC